MSHATVTIQFQSQDANESSVGPSLVVPREITPSQLDLLLNQLLTNEEPVPYSFSVDGEPILTDLGKDILEKGLKTSEEIIQVSYHPQSRFRVRPATRCTSSLEGHTKEILSVAFSPNGRILATGSGDCSVRLWDLATATPIAAGTAVHRNWVLCIAWSPNGRLLASGGMDGVIGLWDGETCQPVGNPLRGHNGFVSCLAWEPPVSGDSFEQSNSRLASASKDGSIKVWDCVRKVCLFTLTSHTASISCLRWGTSGRIYSGSRDRSIKVWKVPRATSCSGQESSCEHGTLERTLTGHAHWVNTMALSTDYLQRCAFFDEQGKPLTHAKSLSSVSERLVTGSDDFTLFLWDLSNNNTSQHQQPIARMTGHQALVNQVVFSPDSRWIASCSFDKSVKLWNASNGAFVATFRGHVGAVYQVAFSSDSRYLISASKDGTVKIWCMNKRQLHSELVGHRDEVYAIDWSPGMGEYVASGGKDRLVKIWRQ